MNGGWEKVGEGGGKRGCGILDGGGSGEVVGGEGRGCEGVMLG